MYLFTTTINNSTFPKKPSPEIVFYDKKERRTNYEHPHNTGFK